MGWSHFERIDGRGESLVTYLGRLVMQHLCRLSSSLLFPWNFVHPTVKKIRLQLQYGRRRGVPLSSRVFVESLG
jgi:hypothetical protein